MPNPKSGTPDPPPQTRYALILAFIWVHTGSGWLGLLGTLLIVAACTVALIPGTLTALGLGYTWTYAFGGDVGVGFGTLTFCAGTLLGCIVCYLLGTMPLAKKCVEKCPEPGCLKLILHAMDDSPFKAHVRNRAPEGNAVASACILQEPHRVHPVRAQGSTGKPNAERRAARSLPFDGAAAADLAATRAARLRAFVCVHGRC